MEEDESCSSLRLQITELELKLAEEKDRYNHLNSQLELSSFVASQEIENHRRVSLLLRETVARLQEDNKTLREREIRDQETIRCLLDEVEKKGRDLRDKVLEFNERAKKRARDNILVDDTVSKFKVSSKLAEQSRDIAARALKVSEEDCSLKRKKNAEENFRVKEREKKRASEVHGENEIPLRLYMKKRPAEVCEGNKAKQESNKRYGLRKKFKKSDFICPSTARKPRSTCRSVVAGKGTKSYKGRNSNYKRYRAYTGRNPSREQCEEAEKRAQIFQRSLRSSNPSFIRSMALSHVSSCFWFSLPTDFCKENLPSHDLNMILEDERGLEYEVIYIGSRTGFSGGWRGFAVDHKLEFGDTLIFELDKPARFKVYIIKAIPVEEPCENQDVDL